jgi:hypothetical protein
MIAAAEGEGTRSIRDRAMLAAALRRSELVGLQLADPAFVAETRTTLATRPRQQTMQLLQRTFLAIDILVDGLVAYADTGPVLLPQSAGNLLGGPGTPQALYDLGGKFAVAHKLAARPTSAPRAVVGNARKIAPEIGIVIEEVVAFDLTVDR